MVEVTQAGRSDAHDLAQLHAEAFDRSWTELEVDMLLESGAVGLMTKGGFILVREAAGEAEILTLAVSPTARREGLGRALLAAAIERLAEAELFLEVAADNTAAIALYRQAGFIQTGVRPGYYPRKSGAVDALLLKRTPDRR